MTPQEFKKLEEGNKVIFQGQILTIKEVGYHYHRGFDIKGIKLFHNRSLILPDALYTRFYNGIYSHRQKLEKMKILPL